MFSFLIINDYINITNITFLIILTFIYHSKTFRNRLTEDDITRPTTSSNNNFSGSGGFGNIITPGVVNVEANRDIFASRIVTRARSQLRSLLPATVENSSERANLMISISSVTKTNDPQMRVFLDSFSSDNGLTFQDSEEALELMPK